MKLNQANVMAQAAAAASEETSTFSSSSLLQPPPASSITVTAGNADASTPSPSSFSSLLDHVGPTVFTGGAQQLRIDGSLIAAIFSSVEGVRGDEWTLAMSPREMSVLSPEYALHTMAWRAHVRACAVRAGCEVIPRRTSATMRAGQTQLHRSHLATPKDDVGSSGSGSRSSSSSSREEVAGGRTTATSSLLAVGAAIRAATSTAQQPFSSSYSSLSGKPMTPATLHEEWRKMAAELGIS